MTYVHKNCRSGFTLIEIMIAIAIVGLLAGIAGPVAMNMYKSAQKKKAIMDLRGIQSGIEFFKIDLGRMPNNPGELVKKPRDPKEAFKWAEGGYFGKKTEVPKDPWGNRYVYKKEPDGNNPYTLYSKGPGGKEKISVWFLD